MNYFLKPTFRSEVLSWLMGVPHIPFTTKREFGVKGDIGSEVCMEFLSAWSRVFKEAGYSGFVIFFDEAEAIARLPQKRSVQNALENVRIFDDNQKHSLKHTYVVFAGTYDFFESIGTYPALQQRIHGGSSYRDPIIEIERLNDSDTVLMLRKIRTIYATAYSEPQSALPSDESILNFLKVEQNEVAPRKLVTALVSEMDQKLSGKRSVPKD